MQITSCILSNTQIGEGFEPATVRQRLMDHCAINLLHATYVKITKSICFFCKCCFYLINHLVSNNSYNVIHNASKKNESANSDRNRQKVKENILF